MTDHVTPHTALPNIWTLLHPHATVEHLGYLPQIINACYAGTVREQITQNYAHGSGYSPFGKDKWKYNQAAQTLNYPGDPELKPIASTMIGDEKVLMYNHAIVAIIQKDGSFDVVRMD
jgi:hypothetical protein